MCPRRVLIPVSIPVLALVLLAVLATACDVVVPADPEPSPTATGPRIDVGAGPDGESLLLAHVMRELLAREGLSAEVERFDDRGSVRQALIQGAVSVAPGYTGEAWLDVLGQAEPPGSPGVSFREVRAAEIERGLNWMRPTLSEEVRPHLPPANATFAFFVQAAPLAGAPSVTTLTEFAALLASDPDARLCVDPEFGQRPDGLQAVLRAYNVDPQRDYIPVVPENAVLGVRAGDCLAGLSTATDGTAWSLNLRPLIDDRRVFPAFVVTPVVRDDVEQRLVVLRALNPLPSHLTTAMLGGWNARVAAGAPVEAVAAAAATTLTALEEAPPPPPQSSPTG